MARSRSSFGRIDWSSTQYEDKGRSLPTSRQNSSPTSSRQTSSPISRQTSSPISGQNGQRTQYIGIGTPSKELTHNVTHVRMDKYFYSVFNLFFLDVQNLFIFGASEFIYFWDVRFGINQPSNKNPPSPINFHFHPWSTNFFIIS